MKKWFDGQGRRFGILLLCCFLGGCLSMFESREEAGLPEHIYRQPVKSPFAGGKVGIFSFSSPSDASTIGTAVAKALYQKLLGVPGFVRLCPEFGREPLGLKDKFQLARSKGYQVIITGAVTYHLAGSLMQGARLDQEIRIYEVKGERLVWYAQATASGKPVKEADFFIFKRQGRPAPSLMTLVDRNAAKFTAMISERSTFAAEMDLIGKGYGLLVARHYSRAREVFEQVLAMNPSNAYALLNLAVVHEYQGDLETARRTYREIISLDPLVEIETSTDPRFVGRPLVELAADNLRRLEDRAAFLAGSQ